MEKILFETNEVCKFKECEVGSKKCLHCEQLVAIDFEEHEFKCRFHNDRGMYYQESFKRFEFQEENMKLKEQIEVLKKRLKNIKNGN